MSDTVPRPRYQRDRPRDRIHQRQHLAPQLPGTNRGILPAITDTQNSRIREATSEDWPAIWPIVRDVVRRADTFTYDPRMTEDAARVMWMVGPPGRTTVAVDGPAVVGTANMYANRAGPGAHIASASFMVASSARGRGVGRALVEDAVSWARATGFRGMQFNAVAETNAGAVALYRALGFSIVGTVPEAFDHPDHGLVGLHVMYRPL